MKAIYINLDPYLQAVADWLNAGKPGTAPSFQPLPVAVTIPLGESVVLFAPRNSQGEEAAYSVDGNILLSNCNVDTTGTNVESDMELGFSKFGKPTEEGYTQLYCAVAVTGDRSIVFEIEDFETTVITSFTIHVLVRREQASGPVDLIDFTPPAAAPSAADIRSALVAAGDTALEGVMLNGTRWLRDGETVSSSVFASSSIGEINPALALTEPGS